MRSYKRMLVRFPPQALVLPLALLVVSQAVAQAPIVNAGGVVNLASSAPAPLAPGSAAAVFGQNLGPLTFPDAPPPTTLGGTSVTIGAVRAP